MTFLETILEETLQIFKKEGIEANTEDDLIRKLDIRKHTYNEMFSGKADLVMQTVLFDIESQKELQAAFLAKANNPVEEIMMLLQDGLDNLQNTNPLFILDVQQKYPEVWQVCLNHFSTHSYFQISDIINKGILQALFRRDINLQLVTKIILEQLTMILNPVIFPPDRYSLEEVFRSVYLYYIRGICTDTGGKMAEAFFAKLNS
ncbi:TetR/AcrR family transcriptional regulator [uncultured Pontibacter sp.]|uniref:TetR/AcrR family transcriptional regulator n=1 Tax=uncultured Pontibacter sp. TaxID=453356 RepID=UPI0026379585|nr:TetR/AcrR family transcriptional regulator [uncultured Pontibacter sp.]